MRKFRFTYTWYHLWVFFLTFYSYALYHVLRKSLSNVKSVMQDQAELFFGYVDSALLFCYAIGLYLSGWIAERVNKRYMLTGGMILSSILTFLFGSVGPWLQIYNVYYYAVIWGINGFIQSTGWPIVVAVMANWFGRSSRGVVFGIWSASSSVGNILSALLISSLLPYGFELAMMACSFLMFTGGILVFFTLPEHPDKFGITVEDVDESQGRNSKITETTNPVFFELNGNIESLTRRNSYCQAVEHDDLIKGSIDENVDVVGHTDASEQGKKKAINFFRAILIPGVIVYSLSYACVKLVNYSLFFWIPYYLNQRYSWATAKRSSQLSTLYDVGGIFGGAIGGWISDRLAGKRSLVVVIMLVLGIVALFIYEGYGTTPLSNGILMCIAGFFVNGPAILESSAISADLGNHPDIKDNTDALSTVTGIVDGTGSLGAAIGQIVIILIEQKTNSWTWVFYFFMVVLAGSALFLSKLFITDAVSLWRALLTKLKAKKPE